MNVRIKIDYNLCTGCGKCIKACTYGVLEKLDDKAVAANPHKCAACLDCEKVCEAKAIKIDIL